MKQSVRIIGGRFRGKKIDFPAVCGLRPTPDRVRETLFNWLMHDLHGAKCLDAFAGSGAIGLEAFSRGASEVEFVEENSIVVTQLKKTVSSFGDSGLHVTHSDSLKFISTTHKTFDIVFLDPPFAECILEEYLRQLYHYKILNPDGLVYIESSYAITPEPACWEILKQKKAGMVFYGLIQQQQR